MIVVLICAAAVIAGYYVLTAGKRPSSAEQWLTGWLYAHRGLHDADRPENSMAAFREAAENGYGIELDVRLTKDGYVVVLHDADLRRMTGACGTVESSTYEELSKLRLAGTQEHIPLFSDVLEMVSGRVPLLVEIKTEGMHSSSINRKTSQLLRFYKGKYALQSFSPFSVRWFRKCAPWDPRGQLSSTFRPWEKGVPKIVQFCARHLLLNFLGRPNFISYCRDGLHAPVVQRLRRHGLPVLAWTVRSASEAAQARKLCDTIIFEGFRPVRWSSHEA